MGREHRPGTSLDGSEERRALPVFPSVDLTHPEKYKGFVTQPAGRDSA